MSDLLSEKDFGLKLYKTLPPLYRREDLNVNQALKRYLEALSDGGFANVIKEINGLLNLIDIDKLDEKSLSTMLPLVFEHYGFKVFNGIPELYLRKMLPMISELYAMKGTTTVIEYLTAIVSGTKSTVDTSEIDNGYKININIEMDFDKTVKYMPDIEQLKKIVDEFVPFFYDTHLVFIYIYDEVGNITMEDHFTESNKEVGANDEGGIKNTLIDTFLNRSSNLLNSSFYTNAIYNYDVIDENGKKTVLVPLEEGNIILQ